MPDSQASRTKNAVTGSAFLLNLRHVATLIFGAAIAALAGSPALAQNQVYDPIPPPGSAYVRFVNALGGEVSLRPDFLSPQKLGTTPALRVTSYAVVENVAGRDLVVDAQAEGRTGRATLHVQPGSYVTVIVEPVTDKGLNAIPVVDNADFNQTRARLSFYNATPSCGSAALSLDPDGPAVFQDVVPGTAKARSVNPVVAQVHATCTGQVSPAFALQDMEAGGMYSVWLMELGGSAAAFLTRDATARWKP